jgi:hypothetical protein
MIIAIQEIGTIVIDIDTTIGIQTELNPTTYSANTRIINHISPIHHIHEAKLTLTGPS